jgi:predicted RNA-binding Zn ribbon-like protein
MSSNHAPGRLRLVQEFVNTLDEDVDSGADSIAEPEALQRWLVDSLLIDPRERVDERDHARVIALRTRLRDLLAAHDGAPVLPGAVDQLNGLVAALPLCVTFGAEGEISVGPGVAGVDGALGHILAAVVASVAEGTWGRLKICRADTCRWAFYDASKNRSGVWCSMKVCGNRAKVRAYQQRRRERGSER